MGDVVPRAIELVTSGAVDVASLVTHRWTPEGAAEAFAMQAAYADGSITSVVEIAPGREAGAARECSGGGGHSSSRERRG